MRNSLEVVLLTIVLAATGIAQEISVHVLSGGNYCREVQLGRSWTAPTKLGEDVMLQFQDGSGKLEFRSAESSSAMVSFFATTYDRRAQANHIYSANKF